MNPNITGPPVHVYKVALNVATLWGSGNYYHSEMLDSASRSGFDAVFFTDNLYFLESGGVADPGFENVTSSGDLRDWNNVTLGNQSPIGITRVNHTLTRSGSSSIEFALENNQDGWASRSVGQSWGAQSRNLHLFGNILLNVSVYVANARVPPPPCSESWCLASGEAWIYFEIILSTQGPHSGPFKHIFFIYDYHPRGTQPASQNSTSSYYLYLSSPTDGWNDFSTNLTRLVKELWNQTIVDYWWIESINLGVKSWHGAYVDALFDDVSVTPTNDFASIQYLRDSINPSISTDTIKAYSGYVLSQSNSFTASILGGNTFQSQFLRTTGVSPSDTIDLRGTDDWNRFSREVGKTGSLLLVNRPTDARMHGMMRSSCKEMNLSVVDLIEDQWLWDQILSGGGIVMIAASGFSHGQAALANPGEFADPDVWTTRVWAAFNAEPALLEAIYLGHSYVARNGFNGQFEFDSLGFETGKLPVYVSQDTEAAIHLKVSGIPRGTVHLISQGREIANATLGASPSTGEFEETFRLGLSGDAAYFRAVITNSTGSPVIISNPIFYVHKPMLSGSYIYVSDPTANVQSWNFTELFTRREVSIRLTADEPSFPVSRKESAMYIRLPTRESRYQITIASLTRFADDFYSNELGEYIVPLSGDLPIVIVLRLDKSVLQALVETGQEVMLLLGFVMIPFVVASVYLAVRALVKRRR